MDRTRRSRRLWGAVVCVALLAAAAGCGDDEGDEGGGSGSSGDFSVADSLAQLPALEGQPLTITTADLDAVAEANGLEPSDGVDDATPEWLATMTGQSGGAAMVVPPAWVRSSTPSEIVATTSFWWAAADRFASASAPPEDFSVFEGDLGEPETEDGNLLVASDGDAVAVSLSDALLQEWQDDDLTTIDDDRLTAVAEQLDAAEAVSAVLLGLGDTAPTVGIGWLGEDEGDALAAIVYGFESEDAAGAAESELEAGYADLGDLLEVDDVAADGSTVTVTVRVAQDEVATPYELVTRGNLPLPQ